MIPLERLRPIGRRLACVFVVAAVGLQAAAQPAHAAPGDLDATFAGFGAGGMVVASGSFGFIAGMTLQPDGKIVTVGTVGSEILLRRFGADGALDLTFFGRGYIRIGHPEHAVYGNGVAVQDDGKLVVAGWADTQPADVLVARVDPSVGLDPSFGAGGFVTTDWDKDTDIARAVLIQPDGKIVVAGEARIDGDYDFAVARYNTDGGLDTTFAGDGKGSAGFGGDDKATDIALQDDGKLVLVGSKETSFDQDFAVARFNSNGSPDKEFDVDGEQATGFGSLTDGARAVAIQRDGRIVVAGDNYDNVQVARYRSNGSLDDSFDGDGKRSIGSLSGSIDDVAIQPDGKIVMLGHHVASADDGNVAFYRLNPDSTLDPTFDADGKAFIDLGGIDYGKSLALMADGRMLAAGEIGHNGENGRNVAMVRLWPDGTLDAGGQQALGWDDPRFPPGSKEKAEGMAVQSDGKIVVAGEVANADRTESDAALARFLPDGRLDTSFGEYGRVTFGVGAFNGARAIAIQPDGKIVTAGYFRTGRTVNFMVARFNANGTADSTFGFGGQNLLDFMGGDDYGWAVALAPDGKIVVAGEAYNGARTVFGAARFNSNGSVDSTFDADGKQLIEQAVGVTHWATSVVVQPDRRVVLAGQVGSDFGLVRLTEGGSVDPTFGVAGWTITNMAGPARISALVRIPTNGWFVAAGTRAKGSDNDFALAEYSPDGVLAMCGSRGERCGNWPTGRAFVDWGASDVAAALDWREDGVVVAAGCAGGQFAWAQLDPFPPQEGGRPTIKGTTDFVGSGECAAGVKFAGPDRIVLAGNQVFGGGSDMNFALARFDTTLAPNIPTATATPTSEPSATASATPTSTPSATLTATSTASPTATSTPTRTASATATDAPTATFTPAPSKSPTGSPTLPPSRTPTSIATAETVAPTPTTSDETPPPTGRVFLPFAAR